MLDTIRFPGKLKLRCILFWTHVCGKKNHVMIRYELLCHETLGTFFSGIKRDVKAHTLVWVKHFQKALLFLVFARRTDSRLIMQPEMLSWW